MKLRFERLLAGSKGVFWVFRKIRRIRRFLLRLARPSQEPSAAYATVIIPALNEERRIADVIAYVLSDPATAEVIVIDDSSIDETVTRARQAGAQVYTSSFLGKGASMQDGVARANKDILVYLDGDIANLRPGIITDMCRPLLRGTADFVKARFGRSGGRVTELTAKPMLKIFFPELAWFAQPLGGMIAARKPLLQELSFENGYGVDIGLLIDAFMYGADLAEVDIGSLEHESQLLQDLSLMANEVSRVIFSRAKEAGRLHIEQIVAMYETQRQASSNLPYILTRRNGRTKLLLLDMDGTITPSRFVVELARATGRTEELAQLLDNQNIDASTRSDQIAALFRFVHRKTFEQAAQAMEIRPGVIEFVNQMRRRGFMVGVVSDSYFVAANILRRRVFADFAVAHTLTFEGDVCTGKLQINPSFLPCENGDKANVCKSNVLRCFLADKTAPKIDETWVVGDNVNDLPLMQLADRAFAIDPKTPNMKNDPKITLIDSFAELLAHLPPEDVKDVPGHIAAQERGE